MGDICFLYRYNGGMRSHNDTFRHLATLLAIVEAGSFTAAAERLDVNRAAISKRVAQMEAELGLPLFERSTRRVTLTPAGQVLLAHYRAASDALQTGLEEAREAMSIVKGRVSISCTSSLAIHWLGPLLHDFAISRPEIQIVLHSLFGDQPQQEADIELRMTETPPADRSVRKLGDVSWSFYASRSYIDQFGLPDHPARLDKHRFVIPTSYDKTSQFRHRQSGELIELAPDVPFSSNLQEVIFELVKRGKGIGLLPSFLLASQRETSDLHRVLGDWMLVGQPAHTLYAIHAPAKYLRAATRAVLAHIADAARPLQAALEP